MEVGFAQTERDALSGEAGLIGLQAPAPDLATLRLELGRVPGAPIQGPPTRQLLGPFGPVAQPTDTQGQLTIDPWLQLVRHPSFFRAYPFGQIDHLPADRQTARGEQAQVNPALLNEDQREAFRNQIVGSYAQQRQVVGIGGVAPLLATADYMDLLAERENRGVSGDFVAITEPFFTATGKRITRPTADPLNPYGAAMRVETPAGTTHAMDQLSSGEQEVLSLAFFVRRLRSRGGILLIDEPELHLHPALQRSLFAQLEEVADRAQVWIVTHSPRLVTAASLPAVLHARAPTVADVNQVHRASAEEDRTAVLEELGIHPIEVLQSQFIVVVEGKTDEQRISALLPLELSPAVVTVAGSAGSVEHTCRNLASAPSLRFIAIRDRDLLSEAEVSRRLAQHPQLFIWPRRSLESELLEPRLLAKTFSRAGQVTTEDTIASSLKSLADRQRPEILAELLEQELKARYEIAPAGDSRVDRLRAYYTETVRVSSQKLAEFDSVLAHVETALDGRWEADHLKLIDGKRALSEYVSLSPFHSLPDLLNAIAATIRAEPDFLPQGFVSLRTRLRALALESRGDVEPAAP